MTSDDQGAMPAPGTQIRLDGQLVTVVAASPTLAGADLVVRQGDDTLSDASLTRADIDCAVVPVNDGGGNPEQALATMWGRWMQHAVPRIRSAVLATRPLQPYAHQDEAVFTHMLAQPRLRFLLADEPGTNPVHIYHLVAPGTREGRVQEVMLSNLEAAGDALGGRIFDLLDATAARAGFDYTRALVETLLIYDAEVEVHDGIRRHRRKTPLLIRFSGAGAFEAAWESLMPLRGASARETSAQNLAPAMRSDSLAEAHDALGREVSKARAEREAWVGQARRQLDEVEYRYLGELEELPFEQRRERMTQFDTLKRQRLEQLGDIAKVTPSAPRLVGWAHVLGGALATELGYDPNSEALAIATVLRELDRLGFDIDDRQTAGVGYDLLARHRTTREQRLVEVKGFQGNLEPVWLEQHEWAQAQQRGQDYWLYVVAECATTPTVVVRAQDPASQLANGPRRIERFQIKLADLRRLMGDTGDGHRRTARY